MASDQLAASVRRARAPRKWLLSTSSQVIRGRLTRLEHAKQVGWSVRSPRAPHDRFVQSPF
ncbi:hypothetical protein JCM33774_84060 [Actinophytocola sp. KF-1]